ncbi:MAG: bacteriorhodopsin-like [Meiothermus sp.]|uniref:hypothetical protein n=1 Tax=Meiothermus sp. TaxID=1955249 RepID=UPI0025E69CD8|nr:hypothetical protein [Meiothermus sp.]MCS7194404.1 bacteriorhodopsin-like [Meiothermus sp.]MCX7740574.1 bacteriorhodopsin-like [Meiothermus sp.]MDW8089885.1 hypothetical protein [Meiothermus sp.]MDW8481688.1 hypothetical protein [Meiothermus sp.]
MIGANTLIITGQYLLVYNVMSLTIAAMLASSLFFLFARAYVAPRYHLGLYLSTLVVWIAAYHYYRIFLSWQGAYEPGEGAQAGFYPSTNEPFNDEQPYLSVLMFTLG